MLIIKQACLAYRRVLSVSSILLAAGLIVAIIAVFEFPPRLSFSSLNLEEKTVTFPSLNFLHIMNVCIEFNLYLNYRRHAQFFNLQNQIAAFPNHCSLASHPHRYVAIWTQKCILIKRRLNWKPLWLYSSFWSILPSYNGARLYCQLSSISQSAGMKTLPVPPTQQPRGFLFNTGKASKWS